jgi:flagellar assembly protein FliH
MSSSTETVRRGRVLRGAAAARAAEAPLATEVLRPTFQPSPIDAAILAQAMEDARAAGHAEGLAAGLAEGRAAAREMIAAQAVALVAQLTDAVESLRRAAAQVAAPQAVALDAFGGDVATLAFSIAEAVVGRELAVAESPGRDAVARALRMDVPAGLTEVHLHPDDLATAGELADLAPDRDLTIVPNPAVERGGCIVRVGTCTIDAQIGAALDRVREALRPSGGERVAS